MITQKHPLGEMQELCGDKVFKEYKLDQNNPTETTNKILSIVESFQGRQLTIEERISMTIFGIYLGEQVIKNFPGLALWELGKSNQDSYVKLYLDEDVIKGRKFIGLNTFMYLNSIYMNDREKLDEFGKVMPLVLQYGKGFLDMVEDYVLITPSGEKIQLARG